MARCGGSVANTDGAMEKPSKSNDAVRDSKREGSFFIGRYSRGYSTDLHDARNKIKGCTLCFRAFVIACVRRAIGSALSEADWRGNPHLSEERRADTGEACGESGPPSSLPRGTGTRRADCKRRRSIANCQGPQGPGARFGA